MVQSPDQPMKIAAIIPCYKVSKAILSLLNAIGPEVDSIYVIDDCCPEKSGQLVKDNCADPRVTVIFHAVNQGVGGAMITGFKAAMKDGVAIAVKLDGDGQMNPALISRFVAPIQAGLADYTKGNRFFALETVSQMPAIRLMGNAVLSFVNKATSGYWDLMDPTNGYLAIHTAILRLLPLDKIEKRYFFESDMLFRLNTIRAVIQEVPMRAIYNDSESSLSIRKVALEFPAKYLTRAFKRIAYNYFLRDFNACSLQLIFGLLLTIAGSTFGAYHWIESMVNQTGAPIGTVMLSALPVILGFQLLLSALNYDVANIPRRPLHPLLAASSLNRQNELEIFI